MTEEAIVSMEYRLNKLSQALNRAYVRRGVRTRVEVRFVQLAGEVK